MLKEVEARSLRASAAVMMKLLLLLLGVAAAQGSGGGPSKPGTTTSAPTVLLCPHSPIRGSTSQSAAAPLPPRRSREEPRVGWGGYTYFSMISPFLGLSFLGNSILYMEKYGN